MTLMDDQETYGLCFLPPGSRRKTADADHKVIIL